MYGNPDNNFREPERDDEELRRDRESELFDESDQRPENPVNKPGEDSIPRKGHARRKAPRPSEFEIGLEKGEATPISDLPERRHESFRHLLISLFLVLECLDYLNVKDLMRLKSFARCHGSISETAEDLGEERSVISHWLLGLEKMYEKHKKRLMGDKKKDHKKED